MLVIFVYCVSHFYLHILILGYFLTRARAHTHTHTHTHIHTHNFYRSRKMHVLSRRCSFVILLLLFTGREGCTCSLAGVGGDCCSSPPGSRASPRSTHGPNLFVDRRRKSRRGKWRRRRRRRKRRRRSKRTRRSGKRRRKTRRRRQCRWRQWHRRWVR